MSDDSNQRNLLLDRRTFIGGSASSMSVGKLDSMGARPEAVFSIWPRWLAALRRLDSRTAAEWEAGVGEEELSALSDYLLDAETQTPAALIVKLEMLLAMAPIRCGIAEDFPWPQICSIIAAHREAAVSAGDRMAR